MKKIASMLVIMSLFASTSAFAQVRQDQAEKAVDRQEIQKDKRHLRDDKRDLRELENVLHRFDRARARGNRAALSAVDADLRRILSNELAEGRREQGQKHMEANRSAGELASDQRELRHDAVTGAPPRVAADDLRDRRDDRKDLADDRRDALVEMDHQERRRHIAHEIAPLLDRHDARSMEHKRGLIVELIGVARGEIHEGRKEKREDKKELREDRRELREDVRQGH